MQAAGVEAQVVPVVQHRTRVLEQMAAIPLSKPLPKATVQEVVVRKVETKTGLMLGMLNLVGVGVEAVHLV